MVKFTSSAFAATILAGSALAQSGSYYRRSADIEDAYLALREDLEMHFGRELTGLERRGVYQYVESRTDDAVPATHHEHHGQHGGPHHGPHGPHAGPHGAFHGEHGHGGRHGPPHEQQSLQSQSGTEGGDTQTNVARGDNEVPAPVHHHVHGGPHGEHGEHGEHGHGPHGPHGGRGPHGAPHGHEHVHVHAAPEQQSLQTGGDGQTNAARSYDDSTLYVREPDFGSWLHNLFHPKPKQPKPTPSATTTSAAPAATTTAAVPPTDAAPVGDAREYYDEEDLMAREYYDEEDLMAREYYDEEDFMAREYYEEDLMAREYFADFDDLD